MLLRERHTLTAFTASTYFPWLLQYVKWNSYLNCNECHKAQWHLLVLTVLLWSHTLMDDVIVQVLVFSWHQTGKTGLDGETQPSSFGLSNMEPNISNPSRKSAVKLVQQWELEGEHTVTTWQASWPQSFSRVSVANMAKHNVSHLDLSLGDIWSSYYCLFLLIWIQSLLLVFPFIC